VTQNNDSAEPQTIKLSQTLCINTKKTSLSFATTSKRYKIDKKGFVVDTEKKSLLILTED
jgi:hypothetical protein